MHRDVLIVGFGLAGWALTEALTKEGKSFVVFDPCAESSSKVATGIYNPVVLKRFRAIYGADELMAHSLPFYKQAKYASTLNQCLYGVSLQTIPNKMIGLQLRITLR